jgi:hypothetical protein
MGPKRWIALVERSEVPMKRVAVVLAIGCVACPAIASAKLPNPRTTRIVAGHSIGGVALGMSRSAVFARWGHASCSVGVCVWRGPGNASYAENARVGFYKGKANNISINAGTTGISQKFKPGELSTWKDRFGNHLGSVVGVAEGDYRRAHFPVKPNTSEGVNGFDMTQGRITTRYGGFGIGPSRGHLRYLEIYCVPDANGGGCP